MNAWAPALLAVAPSGPAFLLAISSVLAVAAIGVGLFAVWRAQALALLADDRSRARVEACEAAAAALQKTLDGVAAELEEVRQQQPAAPLAGVPKGGMNLSKRSQVLRMHRKGDAPERIAAALEVPLQEVDLLIKVHRIVIRHI
jgi:hypothetical protein